jgi:Ala-tRNA(Pro) deacylase
MIPLKVSDYLLSNRASYSAMSHTVAYTAQEEAAAAHVPGAEWAKTVVCFADDQPILAVLPAPFAVDLEELLHVAKAHSIRLARESEFAGLYQDCEVGAIPPLGPLFGQRVFVDRRLTADPEVVFSGGSHQDAIRMPYAEFARVACANVAEFAHAPSLSTPRAVVIDPICGVALAPEKARGHSVHKGETYYFCSLGCEMEFDDNPDAYARPGA